MGAAPEWKIYRGRAMIIKKRQTKAAQIRAARLVHAAARAELRRSRECGSIEVQS